MCLSCTSEIDISSLSSIKFKMLVIHHWEFNLYNSLFVLPLNRGKILGSGQKYLTYIMWPEKKI